MTDKAKDNPHQGHRERMRRRFLQEGLDAFEEHEALELLLYYVIPRKDVNALAHALIDRFGSLAAVVDAPMAALTEVPGVEAKTALLIKFVPQFNRKYQLSQLRQAARPSLNNVKDAARVLAPYFYAREEELVYMACLDLQGMLIRCCRLAVGSDALAAVSVRSVLETALRERAVKVILAHNHPGGMALPSRDDVSSTLHLLQALEAVEIRLEDHLIFAGSEMISMADCGYLKLAAQRADR